MVSQLGGIVIDQGRPTPRPFVVLAAKPTMESEMASGRQHPEGRGIEPDAGRNLLAGPWAHRGDNAHHQLRGYGSPAPRALTVL